MKVCRALLVVAIARATTGCNDASESSAVTDTIGPDAGGDAALPAPDAGIDTAIEDAGHEVLGDDGSGRDGAPQCATSPCATLLYRQFDIIRLVASSRTIITRTGPLASFPSGPGLVGIYARAAAQGQPTPLVDPAPGLGFGMLVADQWVYGCSSQSARPLWRVALRGGGPATDVTTTACFDVVATSTNVFFTVPDSNQIHTLPLTGGTSAPVANTSDYPEALALDDAALFWSFRGNAAGGGIESVPLAGGTPTTLVSNEMISPHAGFELDATHLYWLGGDGVVRRVAKTGGNAETVSGSPSCADIAVSGPHVYCTSERELVRFDKSGAGGLEVIASGFSTPLELIAVDESSIYFTADGVYVPTQSQEADWVFRIDKPVP